MGVVANKKLSGNIPEWISSLKAPNRRHYLDKINQKTAAKEINTVINPSVDVVKDLVAIKNGQAVIKGESKMTSIDKNYSTCAECYVDLRIYPGHIHPDQVSSLLNIEPTTKNIVGTSIINSRGRIREMKISSWFLCSYAYVKSRDLRDHVDWLSSKLENSIYGLRQLQTTDGVKITLGCIWRPINPGGGPVLWPTQLSAIANLDLECSIEIYS